MARGDNESGKGGGGFKLFGVEINLGDELMLNKSCKNKRSHEGDDDECIRKSKSMGNLHEMCIRDEHHTVVGGDDDSAGGLADSGYHSDGLLHLNSSRAAHIRKKGTPWTPSEHRSFLIGLKKLGKGDWKGISKNYVPTRTPTQVASHAQKYFIRMTTAEKKNRRASLFDIPFKESNPPPRASTAALLNASEGSQQVITAAAPPLKKTSEIHGLDGLSAHVAASEKKPPLSPITRTYVTDTCHIPYMAGVPGQSFPASNVMPQTEFYPVVNHTNYQYPSYYYVPSSHGNSPALFMNQKSNGVFLQPYPLLHGTSQARPATPSAGSFATCARFTNHYQTVTGPPTSFATRAPFPNQYQTAKGPATSFAACAPFPNQYQTTNGPATSTVAKKDGLEANIGTLSLNL